MAYIHKKYTQEVVPKLREQFGFDNDFQAPRIMKVVVNSGVGKFIKDSGQVEDIAKSIAAFTGQKPLATQARQSIAGFKIREGLEVGMKVTLRGRRMWDFIEKLVGAALPRVKDFHGLKESAVDSNGNLNIGIKEHLIFPEIFPEQVKNIFSLQVTVVSNAKDKEKGMALFRMMGFPFERKE